MKKLVNLGKFYTILIDGQLSKRSKNDEWPISTLTRKKNKTCEKLCIIKSRKQANKIVKEWVAREKEYAETSKIDYHDIKSTFEIIQCELYGEERL